MRSLFKHAANTRGHPPSSGRPSLCRSSDGALPLLNPQSFLIALNPLSTPSIGSAQSPETVYHPCNACAPTVTTTPSLPTPRAISVTILVARSGASAAASKGARRRAWAGASLAQTRIAPPNRQRASVMTLPPKRQDVATPDRSFRTTVGPPRHPAHVPVRKSLPASVPGTRPRARAKQNSLDLTR